jgi:hypothetical protein
MKNLFRSLVCAAAGLCLAGPAWAGDEAKPKDTKAPKAAPMQKDVVWPADAIKWADGPAPGTHMAKLWGDPMKGGPYGVLIKFDAGLMHPMHWHSRTLKIVVISGTFVHHPDGGEETKLGPGSYLLQAGRRHHISGASADGPCEFFMVSDGKFDMKMVEAPKAK